MTYTASLLTTSEISRMFRVHRVTVTQWINSGKLVAIRTLGGYLRIPRENLINFLQSNGMPLPKELRPDHPAVIIAEDDTDLSSILRKKILEVHADWIVDVAHNGVDALIRIGQVKPDMLILDIRMPQMDGLEVIRRIRQNEQFKKMKIIVFSGHADKEQISLEAGADAFVSKKGRLEDFVHSLPGHLLQAVSKV